ncbi:MULTISPECIES: hypothetical protein [Yersinia]|uniref:hypothetical protein n=1 Tax=Yersinia TaxID=629 RepID=UPI0005DE1F27|nr:MULTISPECIES: hypothetical protein [Yersinia]CNC99381.1 Uncharacterised protein [Yersinia frederiksenii]HDM8386551.1 hypothetical protein [Yersinia enterocolitica]ARB86017.1 hypothetical protein A6J67_20005 [Yersinia sp. FDAARGOS_228]AVL35865.1 hypothetical protein CEQ36_09685 [Yersinia intermedia]VEB12105.1 Uncharacterised protein [Yersinia pseudotuberculosis]
MPMSFPNLESLKRRAKMRNFRQPLENEPEEVYREKFADFMVNIDRVESSEIRSKLGWDILQLDPATALKMMGIDISGLAD